ncbi:LLM class flavin-dependent oxidoreductase [Apibacter raozihei]|uniref:LLM class flavin-dependent oxidoreductase n=1 Tax=Apibacter raozihei TaxID=2500547 RepID=UPI000FE42670|nr:LLM class flavin-dependent oxidoreductase [Apibacter raozihei]
MELGISMFGDIRIDPHTGKIQPAQQRINELLEEIRLMDEVGLDYFGIGEHHRADYAVSSPEIILAAAATMTKNIKLGSAVTVLSSADPVKVYQNFATLDLISDGRAEIMAGRGSFIESFPLFGFNLDDYNELFEEKLNLLLEINEQNNITWKGKFRASLNNQQVLPRAKNDQLNIWLAAGGTPGSVIRAAKLGLPLMIAIIGGNPANFKPLFDLYKQEYINNGHSMDNYQVGIHSHALFGDTSEEIADKYYPYYSAQMDRIGSSRGWHKYSKSQFNAGRSANGAIFVGDVNQTIDKILYQQELFGLTRFAAHMDVGAPEHKDIMHAIELYGTKIAPQVKKSLDK